ncbi:MAG TPA: DNA ligase-associated DEXH box helicase, partial [Acetobacteraceae bacterium]|nr:DNA ligase-associated DEXH box helicase [Acetobacteraceae bacterium]
MYPSQWLRVLPEGLYCEPGGFYIDPTGAVDRAVITHAHSDHARPGHRAVLASADTLALML